MGSQDVRGVGRTFDDFAPQIYRYIYHRLGNLQLAEDLTSEVFVRFIRAGVKPENTLAYLYRCAHNVVVDHVRQNPSFTEPLDERVSAGQGDPARLAEIEAERSRLRHAISRLTHEQQQVVLLRFVEGLSNEEISLVLGRPEGAIKSLQHRALARLRDLLGADARQEGRFEFRGLLER